MINSDELEQLMCEVNSISHQAGEIILEYYNATYEVNIKEDQSPVTSADLAANQFIEQQLQKLTPDIPRISEESQQYSYEERKHWPYFWLIDPLDGTRQFIKNKPDFTVNIALIHQQRPILGSIYLPVEEHLYYAHNDGKAYKKIRDEDSQVINASVSVPENCRVCSNQKNHSEAMRKFFAKLDSYQLITRGSSIKSCLVAEGLADIYPRFGPTWEWDTAAAQCIVEQAGGAITTLNQTPLCYNKPSLLNPAFMAVGDPLNNWSDYLN
jgi:3'(2'), 5'-bisphosphate nucleotidase